MYGFKLDLVSPVFDQFDGNIFIIAYSHKLLGLCVPIWCTHPTDKYIKNWNKNQYFQEQFHIKIWKH